MVLIRILLLVSVAAVFTLQTSAQCNDEIIWDEAEEILGMGIDTTGHWWVHSAPYEGFESITINGESYGPFNEIRDITFQRNGDEWAFIARNMLKWIIVTPSGMREFTPRIDNIYFTTESAELWWVESVEIDRKITNGQRSFMVTYPIKDVELHNFGLVVAWVEQQPGVEVLMRNGVEVARGQTIDLAGVWADGTCVYARRQANRWSVFQGEEELSSNLANVKNLTMNFRGTVFSWAEYYTGAGPRVKMFSLDMMRPWESPALQGIDQPVVLSPDAELIAFRAQRVGRSLVFFNGAEYPAGERAGVPFFSNDGFTMAYATENAGNYIAVNGKLFLLKSQAPIGKPLAISPSGSTVSWATSSTIIVEDLDFNVLRTGRMCDTATPAIYSSRDKEFQSLAVITNRVYLLRCRAR